MKIKKLIIKYKNRLDSTRKLMYLNKNNNERWNQLHERSIQIQRALYDIEMLLK